MFTLKICASIVLIAVIAIAAIEVHSVAGMFHSMTIAVMALFALAIMHLSR